MPATLAEATRALAARLGEPLDDVGEIVGGESIWTKNSLSRTPAALAAFADARAHLYGGRHSAAAARARAAIRRDSAFASAHRLLAEAEALRGRRIAARRSIEAAYRFRDRLTERERLRLVADREALNGRFSEAILAYENLFQHYRDDVTALKSIGLLQRMIGARGGGEGNLAAAYALDPVDWPPLARIARYLGYRGRLPALKALALQRPARD